MKSRQISTKELASYPIPGALPTQRTTLAAGSSTEDCISHVSEELNKLDIAIEEMVKMAYYIKEKLAPVLSNVEPNNAKVSNGPVSSSPLVLTLAGLREKLESTHNVLEDTVSRLDI